MTHVQHIPVILDIMPVGVTLTVAQLRMISKSLDGDPGWKTSASGTGSVVVRLKFEAESRKGYSLNFSPRGALLSVTRLE